MTRTGALKALMFSGCVSVLAGGIAAQAATATADPSQTSGPPAAQSSDQLQEIVVTVQKRSEALETVPMSVSVVSGDSIERSGVTNMLDLGSVVPGLQVNSAGGFTIPSIRGVTSLTNGSGLENNIAIYVDGIYTPDTTSINSDLANISSIDVLKGPQGTLYGRNATGGAILINTLAPSNVDTARFEGSYGDFNDHSYSAYVSGPINDRVRFGVAAYLRETDGYITLSDPTVIGSDSGRSAAPIAQRSVRTKLETDVTDTIKVTLGYNNGLSSDARGLLFTPNAYVIPGFPAPPLRATATDTVSYNNNTYDKIDLQEGTLKLVWKSPIGTLTGYGDYARRDSRLAFDFDGTYAPDTNPFKSYTAQTFTEDTYQAGVDYSIDAIEHLDLVAGASYYNDQFRTTSGDLGDANYGSAGLLSNDDIDSISDAEAVYVDGTYHVTPVWTIAVGGRYSHETKDFAYASTDGTGGYLVAPFEKTQPYSAFTPRASVTYELAPRTDAYVSFSQGFRSGTFNTNGGFSSAADAVPVKEERITAYEVGFKKAADTMRFNIAAYYYNYSDLQVSVTAATPGDPLVPTVILSNAPRAEIFGSDGDLTFTPMEHLDIVVGAAFIHGRYLRFPNATGTGLDVATGTNVSGQVQNWSGQQTARSPSWSGNLGADYVIPTTVGELRLNVNTYSTASYVPNNASTYGSLAGSLADIQRYRDGGYTLLNAQGTWTDPSTHYHVTLYGKNLTNRRYDGTNDGSTFGNFGFLEWPRTYGIKVGVAF
jgi:iron complex outermembrane recepter protein